MPGALERFDQPSQATATANAWQISYIRSSLRRPRRSTSVPIETLSTESRFTADGSGTGSSAGSSRTSLARPRIVVVHGPISARPRRGMATSRESTTTGRRPTWGNSHHQISPRAGRVLKNRLPPLETKPSHPTRRWFPAAPCHTRRKPHRFLPLGYELQARQGPLPPIASPERRRVAAVRSSAIPRRR